MFHEINRRLNWIEQRVAEIEGRLLIVPEPVNPPHPLPRPPAIPRIVPAQPNPLTPKAAPQSPSAESTSTAVPNASVASPILQAATDASRFAVRNEQRAKEREIEYQPPVQELRIEDGSLEQTIGLKWAGWIGAIVLVVAAALGIKFAYDSGWFGVIPSSAKLVLMWMASFTLIGLGEVVYRKVNRISAAGLFGAGVACLFVVSYAGHQYLNMYGREMAFALMAISTVVGCLVATRARMVSIAALSLIGGNLAPFFVHEGQHSPTPLLTYVLMLQITALILSYRGGTLRWWMLRGLSLATTAMWTATTLTPISWGGGWINPHHGNFVFMIVYFALFQGELILSSRRNTSEPLAGVLFSILVTAALASGLMIVFSSDPHLVRGGWLAIIAAACATMATVCRMMYRSSEIPSTALLAQSYWVQSAILLVVAIPIAFTGWAVITGWCSLAVGFALLGVFTGETQHRRLAVVNWSLSIAYLFWVLATGLSAQNQNTLFAIGGTSIPEYFLVSLCLVVVGQLIAFLNLRGDARSNLPPELAFLRKIVLVSASTLWITMSMIGLPLLGATTSIVLYAWWTVFLERLAPRLKLSVHAVAAMMFAVTKWTLIDVACDAFLPQLATRNYTVVLNPVMGVGLLIAISLVAIWYFNRSRWQELLTGQLGAKPIAIGVTILAMATIGLTLEASRAIDQIAAQNTLELGILHTKLLVFTMLWSTSAATLAGLLWRAKSVNRLTQLAKICACLLAGKYIVLDLVMFRLSEVPAGAVMFNLQVLAGLFVLATAAAALGVLKRNGEQRSTTAKLLRFVMLFPPWLIVTLEIDRLAVQQVIASPWIARQVGWSVWWSIYAIVMIGLGFKVRVAPMRYAGLALFGVTLLKVVVIDLASVSTGLRILSFFGLGALLLSTSVLYGKLSPKFLGEGVAA